MRAKISKKNIDVVLRQRYGLKNMAELFELTEHLPAFKDKAVSDLIREFTGYTLKGGLLVTYNPYTDKHEALRIKGFDHIDAPETMLKELSMLHRTRMNMLEQSRERILELSETAQKKYSRDRDLEPKVQRTDKTHKRLQELNVDRPDGPNELER